MKKKIKVNLPKCFSMNFCIFGPKYHNIPATEKKRNPLDTIDISMNNGKLSKNTPLEIVINL